MGDKGFRNGNSFENFELKGKNEMKNKVIGVVFKNFLDAPLDKSAIYMPITAGGKPIGFISEVEDDWIAATFWTKDFEIYTNEDGELCSLEIMGKAEEEW